MQVRTVADLEAAVPKLNILINVVIKNQFIFNTLSFSFNHELHQYDMGNKGGWGLFKIFHNPVFIEAMIVWRFSAVFEGMAMLEITLVHSFTSW